MTRAWLEAWEELVSTLARNPLRTGLTAAGVAWGMFLLVLMTGFGAGLQEGVRRSLGRSAVNAVYFWGRSTSLPYQGYQPGREVDFTNADSEAIATQVVGVDAVAPRNQLGGYRGQSLVRIGDRFTTAAVTGEVPDFARIQPMEIIEGRWINDRDLDGRRRVVVLGATLARELLPDGGAAVGRRVQIDESWFSVVGVFASRLSGEDAEDAETTVSLPMTTFQQAFRRGDRVGWFAVRGEPGVSPQRLETEVRALLSRRHGVHPDDAPAIGSRNAEAELRRVQAAFQGIRAFVLLVGAMTLMAGALGVTNVMLVAVRERTPEIGLRRAVGATARQVRQMILREALLLTVIAGEVGLLAGVAVLELAGAVVAEAFPGLGPPRVDATLVLVASALMLLAGAVAGSLPARRAASIQPVEALRGG